MFEAMMGTMSEATFWVSVAQIIMIDILLGGDNAVVIALACRNLPPEQRRRGIAWGVAGAIGLRVVLIFFAIHLLALPFLNIVGALLLLWIGVKLLDCGDDGEHQVTSCTTLFGAVKTIIIADAVMSLDNVVAVAGAAHGNMALVVFGIAVSIPIILFGSHFVMRLMDRFPLVITLGSGLLGWIAGQMVLNDALVKPMAQDLPGWVPVLCSLAGALFVVGVGKLRARRKDEPVQKISLLPNVNPPASRPRRVRV
jgi:YjbE family integral membrane protein